MAAEAVPAAKRRETRAWTGAQALAWIMWGEPRNVLNWPDTDAIPGFRELFDHAHGALCAAVASGMPVWGRRGQNALTPDLLQPRRLIPPDEWGPDMRIIPYGNYARPDLSGGRGAAGSRFDDLGFSAAEVMRCLKPRSEINVGTVAQETKCRVHLTRLMATAAEKPQPKADVLAGVRATPWGKNIPERAFDRAWNAAIKNAGDTDWGKPGRPRQNRRT